jgi:hypothetical protein
MLKLQNGAARSHFLGEDSEDSSIHSALLEPVRTVDCRLPVVDRDLGQSICNLSAIQVSGVSRRRFVQILRRCLCDLDNGKEVVRVDESLIFIYRMRGRPSDPLTIWCYLSSTESKFGAI